MRVRSDRLRERVRALAMEDPCPEVFIARTGRLLPILLEGYGFTDRELQIMFVLARGLATGQIAGQLYLLPHTVRDHIKAVVDKAGVDSRGELVGQLLSEHLLDSMTGNITQPSVLAASG